MITNRLAIYFFYDNDGIVDDYVYYFLDGLKKVSSKLIVVVNGKLEYKNRKKLEGSVDHLICRDNIGFDSWAYKEVLDFIGWDKIREYDELIMANFTMFGPIYPFEIMFENMNSSEADFWGIQRSYENPNMKYVQGKPTVHGYMPEFPLSSFWVIRESLLHSYEFRNYWKTLHEVKDYADACIYHEPVFSKQMVDFGFRMDTYVSNNERGYCNNPTIDNVYNQVVIEGIPVIRRRAFINAYDPVFDEGFSDSLRQTIEYIELNKLYDTSLMYDNLLRTNDLNELHHRLNNNYIHKYDCNEAKLNEIAIGICLNVNKCNEINKIFELFQEDIIDTYKIFIFTNSPFEINKDYNVEFIFIDCSDEELMHNSFNYFSSKNFKYICIYHDLEEFIGNSIVDMIALKKQIGNLTGSNRVVNSIYNLFEENKRIGLISSFPIYHGKFFGNLGYEWKSGYDEVVTFLKKNNIDINIDKTKPYIGPNGIGFWYRNRLIDSTNFYQNEVIKNNIFEKTITYLFQNKRYYPAYVSGRIDAERDLNMLTMYIKELNNVTKAKIGWSTHFRKLLSIIKTNPTQQIFNDNNQVEYQKIYVEKEINSQEFLETISTSLLLKKIVKRIIPKIIWRYFRKKRFEKSIKG